MSHCRLLVLDKQGFSHDYEIDRVDELVGRADTIFWLDAADPGQEELEVLQREFGLHELVVEDLVRRRQRPKMEMYDRYIFAVFYGARDPSLYEVHMLIGSNYLLTVHQGQADELADVADRWQRQAPRLAPDVGVLVYNLLDTLVDSYFPVVDNITEQVDDLEEEILRSRSPLQVRDLLDLRRDLLRFRRVLSPQRDALNVLARRDDPLFGGDTVVYFQDVYDHSLRLLESVDLLRDLLSGALEVHLSSVSNRLNESVLRMTALTIILMSVTLIAGVYGMNFDVMPELRWLLGYPYSIGLMALIGCVLTWWFKRIGWL
ncbi:MAG: magnesium/cobalt transporter CorA [Chloroflexi bacterium]|nr:magnesium/cobalt transporter CorA [Chloroflexota bacterium]